MQIYEITIADGVTSRVQYSDAEAKRLGLTKPSNKAATPANKAAAPKASRKTRAKATPAPATTTPTE